MYQLMVQHDYLKIDVGRRVGTIFIACGCDWFWALRSIGYEWGNVSSNFSILATTGKMTHPSHDEMGHAITYDQLSASK